MGSTPLIPVSVIADDPSSNDARVHSLYAAFISILVHWCRSPRLLNFDPWRRIFLGPKCETPGSYNFEMVPCCLEKKIVNPCFSRIVCYAVLTGKLKRLKTSLRPFVRGQAGSNLGRVNPEDKDC